MNDKYLERAQVEGEKYWEIYQTTSMDFSLPEMSSGSFAINALTDHALMQPVISPLNHAGSDEDEELEVSNSNLESIPSISNIITATRDESHLPENQMQVRIPAQLSTEIKAQIQALRHLALWPYRKIADTINLPLTTVYRAAQQPVLPPNNPRTTRGRHRLLTPETCKGLIQVATASAEYRRKPLTEIAAIAGVQASAKTLRRMFALEGYHRRVARKKPFLTRKHLVVCKLNKCLFI